MPIVSPVTKGENPPIPVPLMNKFDTPYRYVDSNVLLSTEERCYQRICTEYQTYSLVEPELEGFPPWLPAKLLAFTISSS